MKILSKDYVVQEILDTIALMQLNNETVPSMESSDIDRLAEHYLFTWNEVGDFEADFSKSLLFYLRESFQDEVL